MPRRTRLSGGRSEDNNLCPLQRVFVSGTGEDLRMLLARQKDDDAEPLYGTANNIKNNHNEDGEHHRYRYCRPEELVTLLGRRCSIDLLDALVDLSREDKNLILKDSALEFDPQSRKFASLLLDAAVTAEEDDKDGTSFTVTDSSSNTVGSGSSAALKVKAPTQEEVIDFLVHAVTRRKVDVEARTQDGLSPLDQAVRKNKPALVATLISACGADPNAFDREDGMAACHVAAQCGAIEALAILQTNGADLRKRTHDGAGVVSLANKHGNRLLMSWLLKYAAIDAVSAKEAAESVAASNSNDKKSHGIGEKKSVWSIMFDEKTLIVLLVCIFASALMIALSKVTSDKEKL